MLHAQRRIHFGSETAAELGKTARMPVDIALELRPGVAKEELAGLALAGELVKCLGPAEVLAGGAPCCAGRVVRKSR